MTNVYSRLITSLSLALALTLTACESAADRTDRAVDSALSTAAAAQSDTSAVHAHAAEDGEALFPIMQRLGTNMTALTHALMTDNLDAVTTSAAAIAEHAPISAEELVRIQRVLGDEMATFEAVDESVHTASVRLHDMARAGDTDAIVDQLGQVQRGCVSCHAQFRARLRDDRLAE